VHSKTANRDGRGTRKNRQINEHRDIAATVQSFEKSKNSARARTEDMP
jgi:hypothetical protein